MTKLQWEAVRWLTILSGLISTGLILHFIQNSVIHWLWIIYPIALFVFMIERGVLDFDKDEEVDDEKF